MSTIGERLNEVIEEIVKEELEKFSFEEMLREKIKQKIVESLEQTTILENKDVFYINNGDLDRKLSKILHDMGMPINISGYEYIKEAIILVIKDKHYLKAITKELYPDVANKCKTTPQKVERSIRNAIEVTFSRGNKEFLDEIFTYSYAFKKRKPTNSGFISIVTEYIEQH